MNEIGKWRLYFFFLLLVWFSAYQPSMPWKATRTRSFKIWIKKNCLILNLRVTFTRNSFADGLLKMLLKNVTIWWNNFTVEMHGNGMVKFGSDAKISLLTRNLQIIDTFLPNRPNSTLLRWFSDWVCTKSFQCSKIDSTLYILLSINFYASLISYKLHVQHSWKDIL